MINYFASRSTKRAAFKIGGMESRPKHPSFVVFREPYRWPKVQGSGDKEPWRMFSICPVGMEVQRLIRQIAPNDTFRLGLKRPGESFGKGVGGGVSARRRKLSSDIKYLRFHAYLYPQIYPRKSRAFQRPTA